LVTLYFYVIKYEGIIYMAITLDDLLTELEKFYYYSIQLKRKGGTTEKQYECNVIIYLSEKGESHTRTFNEISLYDLFNSLEGFISGIKRRSFIPKPKTKRKNFLLKSKRKKKTR